MFYVTPHIIMNKKNKVPCYPDFIPLSLDLKDELHPRLSLTHDGVSEFTFAGLYLFRERYNYRISRFYDNYNNGENGSNHLLSSGGFIISGEQKSADLDAGGVNEEVNEGVNKKVKKFFMTPCAAPDWETLASLFATHDYWKNISESVLTPVREEFESRTGRKIIFTEDRDNFDYLYYRNDLAQLPGKKFHKKKNHVNNFLNNYPDNEQKPLNAETIPAAVEVLEIWRQNSVLRDDGDYKAAKEALDLFKTLPLKGTVFFVNKKPAGYCSGESIARGRMFAIHFEKAIDEYKGIYQFVNKSFASSLPSFFTFINREQDLGDEGLRQAKMTYRPCDFVKKYRGVISG